MSRESNTTPQSQVTTDRDAIREWGEEHDMVPVRYESEEGTRIDVVPETETRDEHETISWDEFATEMDSQEQIVVRHGDEEPDMQVVDRSSVLGSATVESDDAQEALLEGETVEAQLSERRVVEHTIVEEATVESEVVDREMLQTETVDAELLTTEIDCDVTRAGQPDESVDAVARFEPGSTLDEPYDVEVEVDEGWTVTKELLERITVESRLADTDVQDTETVESDTLEETVDVEGVQETVIEGQLLDSPRTTDEIAENCHVESRFEGDVIETHLIRRKTIDEEMSVRKQFTGQVTEGETLTADAISRTVVGSEIVDEDEYDADLMVEAAGATAAETTETTGTEAEMTDTEKTEIETSEAEVETTASPVTPTADDEGKTVVNAEGDEIGMVVEVEERTMYVDPDPSLTDQIRSVLGWSDHDEDAYPIDTDQISHVDDDTVVLGEDLTT